jgi:hypothetical protein
MLRLICARFFVIFVVLGFSLIPCAAVRADLLGYWPMTDSPSSTTATDYSGNNLTGYLAGVTNTGSAESFPGTQARTITTTPLPALGTGDFTINVWFKGAPASDTDWLFAIGSPQYQAPNDFQTLALAVSGGHVEATMDGWFHEVSQNGPQANLIWLTDPNAWYQVTLVRSGGAVTTYVNGVQDGTTLTNAYTDSYVGGYDLNIGSFPAAGSSLVGLMNGVAVWNQALTSTEVLALYGGASPLTVTVPEPSTLALWGMGLLSLWAYAWRKRR